MDGEGHLIIIKVLILQEDTVMLNVYVPYLH